MIRAWFLMASLVFIGLAFVYATQGVGSMANTVNQEFAA